MSIGGESVLWANVLSAIRDWLMHLLELGNMIMRDHFRQTLSEDETRNGLPRALAMEPKSVVAWV